MRPRLQSGASGRPLNFTVRGHMLDWRNLTRRQRIGAIFLLVLFTVAAPVLLFVASTSAADRVWYGGLMSLYLGAILDPQSFRLRLGSIADFHAKPPLCFLLIGVGVTLAAIGFIMRHLL